MNTIQPGNTPLQPTSAKLARGIHGANMQTAAEQLAQDSATVTGVMDQPMRAQMAQDVQALKIQLGARLSDQSMTTAVMAAGAIIGGPHGVVLQDLAGKLHTTVASREKLDELAGKIETFHERKDGDPPLADAVFQSLNTNVNRELAGTGIGGKNVPVALFISGAVANSLQDQGGIIQP